MFMESAEKPIVELHEQVSNGLNQIGHPATPQSVNPNNESPLESIKRDVEQWTGSTLKKTMGGASYSINDRGTKGRIATLMNRLRWMKKAA